MLRPNRSFWQYGGGVGGARAGAWRQEAFRWGRSLGQVHPAGSGCGDRGEEHRFLNGMLGGLEGRAEGPGMVEFD